MTDLIKELGIAVVLVTTPFLGTLNTTFLSLDYMRRNGIPAAGIVINSPQLVEQDYIYQDNIALISRATRPLPCLTVPFGGDITDSLKEFCNAITTRL
jgi:dethiobiotin synthetase